MEIRTKQLVEGISLTLLPDEKFKNCVMGIYFAVPLKRETATGIAMIPRLLTAATRRFPDRSALHRELEMLYGAKFRAGVEKIGETQVVSFVGDVIADRYAGEKLFSDLQALMEEVLLHPVACGDAFGNETFEREKEALREEIRGIVNDKRRYALTRCTAEMCKNEPYGICEDGEETALDSLDPENTYALYKEMLKTAKVDIFVSGAFSLADAEEESLRFAEMLGARKVRTPEIGRPLPEKVQYITDREPVQQGKLVIGYRTEIEPTSDEWFALLVYNALFGGGTSSKLFCEVREKMSLCYYASSMLERAKGLLLVQSGIEFDKYDVTLSAIEAEREALARGEITDAEFTGALEGLCNQLRSYQDSPALCMEYLRRQLYAGQMTPPDEAIRKLKTVKREEISKIAARVHMDTVYFLSGLEAENA